MNISCLRPIQTSEAQNIHLNTEQRTCRKGVEHDNPSHTT